MLIIIKWLICAELERQAEEERLAAEEAERVRLAEEEAGKCNSLYWLRFWLDRQFNNCPNYIRARKTT